MTDDLKKMLGPLAPLAGVWEGDKGDDTAPSDDRGTEVNKFRERITFDALGPAVNHEQVLFGLRYTRIAWRIGEQNPFHEEIGFWLWDAQNKQVLRSLLIPRGMTVLAGGTVEPNAKSFQLVADAGSETYGICSNLFLDKEFKTVHFSVRVTIHDEEHFSYEEDTQLKIKGQAELFHHLDKNSLVKVK